MKYKDEIEVRDIDMMPQDGMQEEALMQDADLLIVGGNRGGGKSVVLTLDPLYDTGTATFKAIFFRKTMKEHDKPGSVFDKARNLYGALGAKTTATSYKITFPSGAEALFSHVENESKSALEDRFQGLEFPCILIDEINQFRFETISKLIESNRNASGIRNRIIGTCNPDPDSWLRKFIDWYIGEDGLIIPERDRVMRYFIITGKTIDDVVWGSSYEEVYNKAKAYIDSSLTQDFVDLGMTYKDFIKSFTFIKGSLAENKKLMESQPNYLANVAQGGEEARARNLDGNWNVKLDGEEMVTRSMITDMVEMAQQSDGRKRLSVDVALGGSDNCVLVVWDGTHVIEVEAYQKLRPEDLRTIVDRLKERHSIKEMDIYYDAVGNGQVLKDYKRAYAVEAKAKPIDDSGFDTLKSQIMWQLGSLIQDGAISISDDVAYKKFDIGHGKNKRSMTFLEVLLEERKYIQTIDTDGVIKMLGKKEIKKQLGRSPDFLEALAYGIVHTLIKKKKKGIRGLSNL